MLITSEKAFESSGFSFDVEKFLNSGIATTILVMEGELISINIRPELSFGIKIRMMINKICNGMDLRIFQVLKIEIDLKLFLTFSVSFRESW